MSRPRPHDAVLLQPREPAAAGPLPRAVPALALLGLGVLLFCTLPAVRAHRHLEAQHARLAERTRHAETELEGMRRALRDGAEQTYLRTKALHDLLHRGATYRQERDGQLGSDR